MSGRLSVAIQHHPRRAGLLAGLRVELPTAEVVLDPEPDGPPSAIRSYLECLRRTPDWCDHRLVIQDDAQPCLDFIVRAQLALGEHPRDLVAFFVPGMGTHGIRMREAHARGDAWQALPTSTIWQPVVALAWPRHLVEPFLDWAAKHIDQRASKRKGTYWDDPVVGGFCRAEKLTVWATVPCLVEHPDIGESLVKRKSYKGTNPARKAAVFVAD